MRLFLRSGFVVLFMVSFFPLHPFRAGNEVGMAFQEREAMEKARASNFGDREIDLMHESIGKSLKKFLSYGDLDVTEGSFGDFMKGKDSAGEFFYRFQIREGDVFSEDVYPTHYLFRSHVYLYPDASGERLKRLIIQYYRVNANGVSELSGEYKKELRRIIHPEPGVGEKKEAGKGFSLSSNSGMTIELYEALSTEKPTWEGPDGVPIPIPSLKLKERVRLHDPADPISYGEQSRILRGYKSILRRVDVILNRHARHRELDRLVRIRRIMDFPE